MHRKHRAQSGKQCAERCRSDSLQTDHMWPAERDACRHEQEHDIGDDVERALNGQNGRRIESHCAGNSRCCSKQRIGGDAAPVVDELSAQENREWQDRRRLARRSSLSRGDRRDESATHRQAMHAAQGADQPGADQ